MMRDPLDPQYTAFDAYGNEGPDFEYWAPIWQAERIAEAKALDIVRRRNWLVDRLIVLSGNPMCVYCRTQPANSVDHIVPQSRNGADLLSNYAPVCMWCNLHKGKFTPLEWLNRLEGVPYAAVFGPPIHIPLTDVQSARLAELIQGARA